MALPNDTQFSFLYDFFPKVFSKDVQKAFSVIPSASSPLKHSQCYEKIYIEGEVIKIYSRVYFEEPTDVLKKLISKQQSILFCILLCHHNGFIRIKYLKLLMLSDDSYSSYIAPFLIKLLGEYVIEILEFLDANLDHKHLELCSKFIKENPLYWQTTRSRVMSYWNAYYRSTYPNFNDYIGSSIVRKIENISA